MERERSGMMCFSGFCKYERWDGECRLPMISPYPLDAWCQEDVREEMEAELGSEDEGGEAWE